MTTSRIGRGALVTLGAAASMAWAAGAANACETAPKSPTPNTHDHHGTDTSHKTGSTKQHPDTACTVDEKDVQWAPVGADGKAVGGFQSADKFQGIPTGHEPVYGIEVKLAGDAANCTGSIPVSLASYDTHGKTWDESGGVQTFVDYDTTTLSNTPKDSSSHVLKVKLPGAPGQASCFGQIDLYFGTTVYDGKTGAGHGPLPDHDSGVSAPKSSELIAAWNGADAGGCAVVPPTSPPPSHPTTPPTTPPTTSPTTHPSTPVTSKTTAPPTPASSTGTTPSTPATTTSSPGTPTLAHTGADTGELSLVALAFFGAGGTAMFASRKAKLAGARKH